MSNFRDLLRKVRSEIAEVTPEEVQERLGAGRRIQILDVREDEEVRNGTVPGARTLSRAHFESRAEDMLPDKDAPVVVYCQSGVRSAFAAKTLAELGYSDVSSMKGGFTRWKDLGYDFSIPRILSTAQKDRYSRHLILPEVGEAGQKKLLDSNVVEESNLQRQIVHNTDRIGVLKAESAKEAMTKLNPDVDVVVHAFRIDNSNAHELISQYDVVVDGCDNFDTRYVVNDAAVDLRVPVVHGSIFRFEGMASTFVPYEGPCYRCLYPEAPPPELAPTWSEAGVLGVLPGIVGCLQ